MTWQTVIGLEVHIQLATKSKLFSGSSTAFGAKANTQASVIDLGLPGVLPALNKDVINMAIKFGLAINAHINRTSLFARKNYFYPDLPKGYQITQDRIPIISGGHLPVVFRNEDGDDQVTDILIERAHLEEDAGKSVHDADTPGSGIDLNRAGMPLLEIVSEPQLRSAKEAVSYLKTLHTLVRHLGICSGNMQEGAFRCDANVSVRPSENDPLGTRVELKNINSFRFVERAINYEVQRQIETLEDGGSLVQETRLYDSVNNVTRSMRNKEAAHDYRYFPDPDLPPLVIDETQIDAVSATMPELPWEMRKRFEEAHGLSAYDANILITSAETARYFEQVLAITQGDAKLVANWINSELFGALNKASLELHESPVSAEQLAELLKKIEDSTISGKIAKTVFEAMWNGDGSAEEIIAAKGLQQITDSSQIEALVDQVITDNPDQVAEYKEGKDRLFGFFVGKVMQASQGKANPGQVNTLLKDKLAK